MEIRKIENIMRLMQTYQIDELEISDNQLKIKLLRQKHNTSELTPPTPNKIPHKKNSKRHTIVSPFVGTFYHAPSPGAEPYIKLGQEVTKGQVLCIIEAMKLMNEIEAEVSGKVVDILVKNAQPVEFEQPLIVIE